MDPIEGVTLAQYAAAVAASAEGHPLPDALGWAGVTPGTWPAAAAGWRKTLAGDPAALAAHQVELAKAEDRLHRRVPPIEEDAAAWVAFMGCVAKAPDVISLLAKVDLGPNDISRISRAWSRRIAADAALKKRIGELRGRGDGAMPAVRPDARRPLDRAAPPAPPAALPSVSPPAPEAEPSSPPPSVPAPVVVPTYLAQKAAPPSQPAPALTPNVTLDVSEVVQNAAALPFTAKPAGLAFGSTQDVSDFAESAPALPFVPSAPAPAPPPAPPPSIPARPSAPSAPARRVGMIGGGATLDLSALMEGEGMGSEPALPFRDPRASLRAGLTVDVGELPQSEKALPHAKPRAGAPVSTARPPSTGTVDVSDVVGAGPALPFGPPPPASFPSAPASLSLEQYASLTVELAQAPPGSRAEDTLRRYGLTRAGKDRLDAEWRGRLADASARAAFEGACATYRAWLLQQSR